MNPILKKFGLSETKHQLKFDLPESSLNSTHKFRRQQQSNQKVSSRIQKKYVNTLFDEIIELLRVRSGQKCRINGHQHNSIKYICLEQGCSTRVGCSYCFLKGHSGHSKAEILTCIYDLVELNNNLQNCQQNIRNSLNIQYKKVIYEIDMELESIKNQFNTNLAFLHKYLDYLFRKVIKHIENYMESFNDIVGSSIQPEEKLISKFKLMNQSQNQLSMRQQTKKSCLYHKYFKKKNFQCAQLNKDEQKYQQYTEILLKRLGRLNVEAIEKHIKLTFDNFNIQKKSLCSYPIFFEEINSSISSIFATFKKQIPIMKFKQYENNTLYNLLYCNRFH